jgi:phytoene synthase
LFEASARMGTPALSYRSAWAVLSAAAIYGAIGRKVAKRGRRAWDGRVGTGKLEKLGFMTRASIQAARRDRMRITPRDPGLWTRPR